MHSFQWDGVNDAGAAMTSLTSDQLQRVMPKLPAAKRTLYLTGLVRVGDHWRLYGPVFRIEP